MNSLSVWDDRTLCPRYGVLSRVTDYSDSDMDTGRRLKRYRGPGRPPHSEDPEPPGPQLSPYTVGAGPII